MDVWLQEAFSWTISQNITRTCDSELISSSKRTGVRQPHKTGIFRFQLNLNSMRNTITDKNGFMGLEFNSFYFSENYTIDVRVVQILLGHLGLAII